MATTNVDSDCTETTVTPLMQACMSSDFPLVQSLMAEKGVNMEAVDGNGNTALCLAAMSGDPQIVTTLIELGANKEHVNNDGDTALNLSIIFSNEPIASVLIESGSSVNKSNEDGNTALCLAAMKMDSCDNLVKRLIECGADINHKNNNNDTPMILAISRNNAKVALTLIELGSNLEHRNDDGDNAIFLAVSTKNEQVVSALADHGADLDVRDASLCTPTIIAAKRNYSDVLSLLIKGGANLNCQDKNGRTAIMEACWNYFQVCAELLLDGGADTSLKDKDGHALLGYYLQHNWHFSFPSKRDFVRFLLSNTTNVGKDFHMMILNRFSWTDFNCIKEHHNVFLSVECFENVKIVPSNAMTSLKGKRLTPFTCALLRNNLGMARFFVSNWFLNSRDLVQSAHNISFPRRHSYLDSGAEARHVFLKELFSQPWTLKSLSFIHASTYLGFGSSRKERLKVSGLPPVVQRWMRFETEEWKNGSLECAELTFPSVHVRNNEE